MCLRATDASVATLLVKLISEVRVIFVDDSKATNNSVSVETEAVFSAQVYLAPKFAMAKGVASTLLI